MMKKSVMIATLMTMVFCLGLMLAPASALAKAEKRNVEFTFVIANPESVWKNLYMMCGSGLPLEGITIGIYADEKAVQEIKLKKGQPLQTSYLLKGQTSAPNCKAQVVFDLKGASDLRGWKSFVDSGTLKVLSIEETKVVNLCF